jgi:L-threonylcarbamoyladenylate synthase
MPSKMIDVRDPDRAGESLSKAAAAVLSGRIVALPTESFYGLAVNAMDESAIRRLLEVKQVKKPHPILLLIPSVEGLDQYVRRIPPIAEVLIEKFWPGGLTLVMEARRNISPLLTAGTGKIGVRLSSHPIAAGLARAVGLPVTGTSANITGSRPCVLANEVLRSLGGAVDLILDGGETEGGKGSTVLDVAADPPRLLREGMVDRERLRPRVAGSWGDGSSAKRVRLEIGK